MIGRSCLLLAVLLGGCADKTGILVEVRSDDLEVPADIDALHFQATSTGDRTIDETFSIQSDWPHSLTILPAGDSDGAITVTVTGLLAGAARVRRVTRPIPFVRGTTQRYVVTLQRSCLDVPCAVGVDCVDGVCLDQPLPDGGVDGGGMDAGRFDAGPMNDAGMDGGRDAGVDAGPDAGRDAGRDAGGDAGMDAGRPDGGDPGTGVLIISEYVEGSSQNKYLEIFNPTFAPISLTGYSVRIYSNGSLTATSTINLTGTIASGDAFILANTSAALTGVTADQLSGSVNFNGDDAVTLEGPAPMGRLDIVGVIGSMVIFGANTTFVRNAGIVRGQTGNTWVPSEWSTLPIDTHQLGSHSP